MIEPVIATALILSIFALIAYYLQPQQPQNQRHYYHQVRRSRVMADPQRRSRGSGVDGEAEITGGREGESEVYGRENEEGEGDDEGRGEVAIRLRELGLIGRGVVGSRLVQEEGVDAEGEKRLGMKMSGECHGSKVERVDIAPHSASTNLSAQEPDMRTDTASQRPSRPIMRLTIPASDTSSTVVLTHNAEHDTEFDNLGHDTLDKQRRQRV